MRARRLATILCSLSLPLAAIGQQEPEAVVLGGVAGTSDARFGARTWLFNEDAQLPAAGQGAVFSRLTWSSQASRADRPFAGNLGSPGAMVEIGGELGLGASLSLQAIGVQGAAYQTDSAATGAQIGVRWSPLGTDRRSTRLV